jgi:hypothetical protein
MTEEDARLALLKVELDAVENSIRSMDSIAFQIKGWCVTAALAIGGFAISTHTPALTLIGLVAIIGFYFINCQFKAIQRAFFRRNGEIDAELKSVGIMRFLQGGGSFEVVGTAIPEFSLSGDRYWQKAGSFLLSIWHEARMPNTFTLYLFLFLCLSVEAIIVYV